jgi:hypothetical protein
MEVLFMGTPASRVLRSAWRTCIGWSGTLTAHLKWKSVPGTGFRPRFEESSRPAALGASADFVMLIVTSRSVDDGGCIAVQKCSTLCGALGDARKVINGTRESDRRR